MREHTINDDMRISCPDTFSVMDEEERYRVLRDRAYKNFGVWDHEAHIIMTASWRPMGKIGLFFADPKSMAKRTRSYSGRLVPGFSGYEIKKLSIAGRKAYGFSYTYTVENMSHRGWTFLRKTDKAMYTVNFAARGDDRQAEGTIRSIMESMKIL